MAHAGAIIRVLMLLLCVVPFASARQAGSAFAPILPRLPLAPVSGAPAPVEEEDERETSERQERLHANSRQRAFSRTWVGNQLIKRHPLSAPQVSARPAAPFDADPFRNGLGSPYRC